MRRWIGGILLGIARWIGRLAWPLLVLWVVCHYVQISIKCPDPRDAFGHIFVGASSGSVGVLSVAQRQIASGAWAELSLDRGASEFQRWLPSRRREDLQWTWRIAHRGAAEYAFRFDDAPPPKQVSVVPLLLLIGGLVGFTLLQPRSVYTAPARTLVLRRSHARFLLGVAAFAAIIPFVGFYRIWQTRESAGGLRAFGQINGESWCVDVDSFGTGVRNSSLKLKMTTLRFLYPDIEHELLSAQIGPISQSLVISPLTEALGKSTPFFRLTPALAVRVPHMLPAALVALLAWWRFRLLRRRSLAGHCPKCSYNLTGNTSGVCPECGTPIHAPRPRRDPLLIRQRIGEFAKPAYRWVWPTIAALAIMLLALDVVLLGATFLLRANSAEPIATTSITLRAWCYWGIVWLTMIAAAIGVLARRIEPPGNARYRFVVAANLILIILLTWPVPPPPQSEAQHQAYRDAQQSAEW